MRGRHLLACVLVVLCGAAGARAQPKVPGPDELERPKRAPNRGVKVSVLGGVEGYTGGLADSVDPGPGWGVLVAAQPLNEVGVELMYSGATNALTGESTGGRLTRHAASAGFKFSLSADRVEPYLFAGIGLAHVGVWDAPAGSGFSDDFYGLAPLGAGISLYFGQFAVGVRGGIGLVFADGFAPPGAAPSNLWSGQLELGAKF